MALDVLVLLLVLVVNLEPVLARGTDADKYCDGVAACESAAPLMAQPKPIDVIDMHATSLSYADIGSFRRPVVLRNSVATTWKAFDRWNMKYLLKNIPVVSAYVQSHPLFITFHGLFASFSCIF